MANCAELGCKCKKYNNRATLTFQPEPTQAYKHTWTRVHSLHQMPNVDPNTYA